MNRIKKYIRNTFASFLQKIYPNLKNLEDLNSFNGCKILNSNIPTNSKLYGPYSIIDSRIGEYSYISRNSLISKTIIGKYCSIGPNFLCGWGIHPTNGISTSPMFYSNKKQNGFSLCEINKVEERRDIIIGNDVFIGANVTILDGVKIGNGAIIGAGTIVAKNVPDYAIVVGSPMKIIRYRFSEDQINKLLKIKWWDFGQKNIKDVERMFFDLNGFIKKYEA